MAELRLRISLVSLLRDVLCVFMITGLVHENPVPAYEAGDIIKAELGRQKLERMDFLLQTFNFTERREIWLMMK